MTDEGARSGLSRGPADRVAAGRVSPRRAGLGEALSTLARLAVALLIVGLPFRARIDVLPHPVAMLTATQTDLLVYVVDLLALATLGLWLLARVLDRRPVSLGPLALRVPISALVVLAWLTIPSAIAPGVSVVGATRITLGALLAVYVLNEVRGLRSVAVPLGLMLGLQAAVAIGQVATGGSVGLQAIGELTLDPKVHWTSVVTVGDEVRLLRAYGLTPHPNILGGILACGALLLAGLPTRGRLARAVQLGLVVLAAAALVATFSRGAWLGALVGGLVGLGLLLVARRPVEARRWVVAGALALAVAGGAAWLARDAVAARTRLAPTVAPTEARSVDERVEQIRLGWRIFTEHPLTGVGASGVAIAMREAEPAFVYGFFPPHVVPLTVAGELGVAGGMASLWLLVAPWVLLARARARVDLELAATSAALAALTAVSLFDIYPWAGGPGRTLGWLVIGLWAMAWARAEGAATGGDERHAGAAETSANAAEVRAAAGARARALPADGASTVP